VRRRRQRLRRDDRRQDRSVHAESRRSESEAQARHEQLRRRLGGGDVSGAGFFDRLGTSPFDRLRAGTAAQRSRAPARHGAALHQMGSDGGGTVIALATREFHLFQAAGRDFLYLVPSAAVFALDEATAAVLNVVTASPADEAGVIATLAARFDAAAVRTATRELLDVRAIGYEQQPDAEPPRAAEVGKEIDFSLTTNATRLRPEIIEFLAENRIGVTISIDGPREMQDKFRVFHGGAGSYDVVAPKIKELLARHRSRPIGARVTLTSDTLDIRRIYQHLTDEM